MENQNHPAQPTKPQPQAPTQTQSQTDNKPKQVSKLKWFLIGSASTFLVLLIILPIIGFLAMSTLVAVNPGRQFEQARDAQRKADTLAIANAIYQYASANNGNLPGNFTTTDTCIGYTQPCIDLALSLVPTYMKELPMDPSSGNEANTGYTISRGIDGYITVKATAEGDTPIEIKR